jgi:hypothetical protein
VISTAVDCRYVGKVDLGGRLVDAYKKTERATKVNKKNGENTEVETKTTYWFGDDGTMLKSEHVSDSRAPSMTARNFIIVEWTIDPSLVITEPTVTAAKP